MAGILNTILIRIQYHLMCLNHPKANITGI